MARPMSAPRGTRDLLPEEAAAWTRVEAAARSLSERYGFDRIETPLFERVELFARSSGETSDVVEKEMFRVQGAAAPDEERAAWALRPEPTAGIVRAYIEHGLQVRPGPLRFWLIGPMFRYARPQAGRYRQFTQWDVEVVGDPGPAVDAELVELAHRFYAEVGIPGVVSHVNSIGDPVCRPRFREALLEYFGAHRDRLSDDSRRRLETNPLRVLDDKLLDEAVAGGAPRAVDYLCEPCRSHFEAVLHLLDALGLAYVIDHRLVRGLDYYTRTTFEFFVAGREGQQQALGGGGRYDGLVEHLGGRATPGIGFGLGIDRAVLAIEELGASLASDGPLVVVVGDPAGGSAVRLQVAGALRAFRPPGLDPGEPQLRVRVDGSDRKLGRQLESAAKAGARWVVIVPGEAIGDPATITVVLRDLVSHEQRDLSLAAVPGAVRAR
jgi:histidyl-tRNA synthetase